jgi:hypothetical protein
VVTFDSEALRKVAESSSPRRHGGTEKMI